MAEERPARGQLAVRGRGGTAAPAHSPGSGKPLSMLVCGRAGGKDGRRETGNEGEVHGRSKEGGRDGHLRAARPGREPEFLSV